MASALTRAVGVVSRRLGRPELLALVDERARQAQREAIGISAVLAGVLPSGGTYVDVGANRGQVLRDALRVAPRGHHLAFEPIPDLAAQLRRDFPIVDCRQLALGARAEVAQFCHFTRLDGWSGLKRSPHVSDERGAPQYITVEVSTLDAELAGHRPSVIKLDVEGAELAVLEGGRSIIAETLPVLIFEHVGEQAAVYGYSSERIWDVLEELDYEVFSVTGEGPFTRGAFADAPGSRNWLARPRSRRPGASAQ